MHHATRRPIALRVAATLAVTTVLLAGASAADAAPRKLPYKKGSAATIAKRGWGAVAAPAVPVVPAAPVAADPLSNRSARLGDAQARALLAANGISVYSSGDARPGRRRPAPAWTRSWPG